MAPFVLSVPRTRLRHAVHPRAITADQEEPVAPAPEPRVEGRDWLGIVGLVIVCLAVGSIYEAAGWIVLGVALLLIAWRV